MFFGGTHRVRSRVFLPALAALVVAGAQAADRIASDTLELPESQVRGSAPVAPPDAAVHRLDAAALRRFASLEEAIESLPGYRVRRQGGLGGYSELSFRGARASQVDVYVDGIRLNQDGDAAPDLSKWPLLWFSSLEARSGLDAEGTSGSPGSLARIDLSTHAAGRANAQVRVGSFSTAEAAVGAQSSPVDTGAWRWSVGAQAQSSRNDYPYYDDNHTHFFTDDDRVVSLDNNAYGSRGLRAALRHDGEAGGHAFSVLWLESRKEYPGLFPATARAHGRREEWLAAWRFTRFGDVLPWEAGMQARRLDDAYRDPGQSLGYLSYEAARVSLSGEADARARLPLGGRFDLRADARARGDETKPRITPFSAAYAAPESRRGELQFGAALDARLSERISASVEARRAFIRFHADGLVNVTDTAAGRLASARQSPSALRAAVQWTSGAQAAGLGARLEQRAPSSVQLLGDNLGALSKLDLRPEETRALSAFYAVKTASARAQATVFHNAYRDPIRLKSHGASSFLRYENDRDYRALGAELSAALDARAAEASLSLTLQDVSIDEGIYAGNRPAYQSPVEARAELFAKPLPGVRLGPLVDFRSAYYPVESNIPVSRRDDEWEFGAHAGVVKGPARLAADARNLTDRRYRDFIYSPRSGRSYSLTLSITL
jgi:hypothetical protein